MLNLPIDPRTVAFDAVVRKLKSDPVLSRIIKTWRASPFTVVPPSASELPMCVIGLKPGLITVATPNSHAASLIITLDFVVAGEDYRDIINLNGAMETAVDPFGDLAWLRDPVVATDKALLYGLLFVQQGYNFVPLAEYNALAGSAAFTVSLKINPTRC